MAKRKTYPRRTPRRGAVANAEQVGITPDLSVQQPESFAKFSRPFTQGSPLSVSKRVMGPQTPPANHASLIRVDQHRQGRIFIYSVRGTIPVHHTMQLL